MSGAQWRAVTAQAASLVEAGSQACATCRFWRPPEGTAPPRCQRRPPVVIYPSGVAWPEVRPEEWCGEWEVKP